MALVLSSECKYRRRLSQPTIDTNVKKISRSVTPNNNGGDITVKTCEVLKNKLNNIDKLKLTRNRSSPVIMCRKLEFGN